MAGNVKPEAYLPSRLGHEQLPDLLIGLQRGMREISQNLNSVLSGNAFNYSEGTAAPTTGSFAANAFRRNTAPTELGVAPNKYIILGWITPAGGSPGTWYECRTLTGN